MLSSIVSLLHVRLLFVHTIFGPSKSSYLEGLENRCISRAPQFVRKEEPGKKRVGGKKSFLLNFGRFVLSPRTREDYKEACLASGLTSDLPDPRP
mmetsp:Transcript_1300/g.1371  ORF Transcript_1300/g.1371 Transcript_1300/m.1371 type:complete len:95 (-) Transcript_1300:213-497(-)